MIVNHIDEREHLPDWKRAVILKKGVNELQRKLLEALYISVNKNMNKRTGDIKWARTTAAVMARQEIKKAGHQPLPHPGPDTPRRDPRDPT